MQNICAGNPVKLCVEAKRGRDGSAITTGYFSAHSGISKRKWDDIKSISGEVGIIRQQHYTDGQSG